MNFGEWMMMEGMRDLARAYSDALRDVPENPEHHPEGTTLKHVKLVRRAISSAERELQNLKSAPVFSDILSDLDFRLTEDDRQVPVNYPRLKPWACHSNSRQPLNGLLADDYRLIDAAL